MGANQSYEADYCDVISASQAAEQRMERRHLDGGGGHQNKKRRAKPAAPHRPTVTGVTHNTISLSWLPPRHTLHAIIAYTVEMCKPRHHAKNWLTLTKNCQGTHYEARHLDSDTEYVFRVRAENIFGTGKHSALSDAVTTKIFEMTSDLNCYISPSTTSSSLSPVSPVIERGFPKSVSYDNNLTLTDSPDNLFVCNGENGLVKLPSLPTNPSSGQNMHQFGSLKLKRRHSFNVQLDGRVSTILNHSDRFYSSNSINSSTSTIVVNGSNANININNIKNDTDNAKRRSGSTSSIERNNLYRTSFQTHRKSSIPILLPGAGSNSLDRLKESRFSMKSSSGDVTTGNHQSTLPRQRGSVNRNNTKFRESRSSLGSSASSDTNTNTSSTGSSKEDNNNGKACQGSRLSLQSALSDVTMSNNSQSSDEPSSRPVSFSDVGENTELSSFLTSSSDDRDSSITIHDGHTFPLDNDTTMRNGGFDNNCLNEDDDIYRLKHDLKNAEITEEKLKFHDLTGGLQHLDFSDEITRGLNDNNINCSDYYQSLENPWEKVTNTNSVRSLSENIMAAPFSDDIKIALNAKNNFGDVSGGSYRSATNQNWEDIGGIGGEDRDDFRTLRSVLQSNHMIVKQSRSMPEVVGVVYGERGETRTLTRGKLTTIKDEDEEEEAVRVTTL